MRLQILTLLTVLSATYNVAAARLDLSHIDCQGQGSGPLMLVTDASGEILSGALTSPVNGYRTCDLSKDRTRLALEDGELLLQGDCVGRVKLLFNERSGFVYAVDKDSGVELASTSCQGIAQNPHPERMVVSEYGSSRGKSFADDESTFPDLRARALSDLQARVRAQCLRGGYSGEPVLLSQPNVDAGLACGPPRGSAHALYFCQ